MKGDISPIGSNIFDAKLKRLLFVIGSWNEIISFGEINLKQSEVKSHETPSTLSGSRESNSTNGDDAFLSGYML